MPAAFETTLDTGGADGSPGTSTNTDALGPPNMRFKRADDPNIDSNNPMIIPSSGTNYSRWKQFYLKCTTAPDTQVDNVKFYSDGTGFGTGITVKAADQTPTHNSAATTGYEVADVEDEELVAGHSLVTSSSDLFATYVSGTPLSVSISETGSIIDAIGETTDYVILQMEVLNTAASGNLADETLTFEYDEI